MSAVLFRSGFGSLTPPSDGCPAGSGDAVKPHGAALAARSPGSWLPTVSFSQTRKPDLDRIRQRVGRAPSGLAWVSLHSVPGDLDLPSGEGRAEGARLCAPDSALRRRRCVAAAGTGKIRSRKNWLPSEMVNTVRICMVFVWNINGLICVFKIQGSPSPVKFSYDFSSFVNYN